MSAVDGLFDAPRATGGGSLNARARHAGSGFAQQTAGGVQLLLDDPQLLLNGFVGIA